MSDQDTTRRQHDLTMKCAALFNAEPDPDVVGKVLAILVSTWVHGHRAHKPEEQADYTEAVLDGWIDLLDKALPVAEKMQAAGRAGGRTDAT